MNFRIGEIHLSVSSRTGDSSRTRDSSESAWKINLRDQNLNLSKLSNNANLEHSYIVYDQSQVQREPEPRQHDSECGTYNSLWIYYFIF